MRFSRRSIRPPKRSFLKRIFRMDSLQKSRAATLKILPKMKYVLITSARNEQAFIAKTLESVTAQTQLPERWVVVDDGSTDETADIAARYAEKFPWIVLIRNPRREGRDFASKANNVNGALAQMQNLDFD